MRDPGDRKMDLARLEAMTAALEAFLDGDAPYREVAVDADSGGLRTSTISVGLLLDLLEALERDAASLAPDERARLAQARRSFDGLRRGRRADYDRLLLRELKGQIDAWRWFLDDCLRGEGGAADAYASEARKRSRIAQLIDEARALGIDAREAAERIADLDLALRGVLRPGAYCGPPGEEALHPPERFWWLYGRPERRRRDV